MDSQIVSITDLKEYDDQVKAWSPKNYIQVGADNTISKPKISVVDDLPASPANDTIYFVKNAPETYRAVPDRIDIEFNDTLPHLIHIKNSEDVNVTPTRVQMLNGSHFNSFITPPTADFASIRAKAVNTSGSTYTDTLRIYFNNSLGIEQYIDVPVTQASGHIYTVVPSSHTLAYDGTLDPILFKVVDENSTAQRINSFSITGTDADKFQGLKTPTAILLSPKTINTSGRNYTATLNLVTDAGTFIATLIQAYGNTYTISPTSKTFNWNDTSDAIFGVYYSGSVPQSISSFSITGSDSNKFTARQVDNFIFVNNTGNNESGSYYNATLNIVVGTETYTASLRQEYYTPSPPPPTDPLYWITPPYWNGNQRIRWEAGGETGSLSFRWRQHFVDARGWSEWSYVTVTSPGEDFDECDTSIDDVEIDY